VLAGPEPVGPVTWQPARPDKPSLAWHAGVATDSPTLYCVFPANALNVGRVTSMLIEPTLADAVLPATSLADPVTDWLAPLLLNVTSDVHVETAVSRQRR